ncbi:MAG: YdcF family protein [Myxococcota bacterium]|nr:YdcF family protein [Myxococcota bacterium]
MTLAAALIALSLFVEHRYQDRIVPLADAPARKVALVFGAGLAPGQEPSPVLAERLDAAIALYRAGKVRKLLVSGDNSDRFHDETRAMRRYAVEHGVAKDDVVGDHAGLSTYDSCVRAQKIFGVSEAILVTQRFHLTRALYIANSIGIDAVGVAADEDRRGGSSYALRELVSRPVAWVMVHAGWEPQFLGKPLPIE